MAKVKLQIATEALETLGRMTWDVHIAATSSAYVEVLQSDFSVVGGPTNARELLRQKHEQATASARDHVADAYSEGVQTIALGAYEFAMSVNPAAPVWTIVFGQAPTGEVVTGWDYWSQVVALVEMAAVIGAGAAWARDTVARTTPRIGVSETLAPS